VSVLVIAATPPESAWAPPDQTVVCGIGPVDAAARTAAILVARRAAAVLHVGVAGARRASGIPVGSIVIGRRAHYADIRARIRHAHACEADPVLLRAVCSALPDARVCDIATSAAVGSPHDAPVEGMEGFAVLRACALAGVPAVEVRVISNEVEEQDRAAWRIAEACAVLAVAGPVALRAVEGALPEQAACSSATRPTRQRRA
jgi:futalosine hydrolase